MIYEKIIIGLENGLARIGKQVIIWTIMDQFTGARVQRKRLMS